MGGACAFAGASAIAVGAALTGCAGAPDAALPARTEFVPPDEAGYPAGFSTWPSAPEMVRDEAAGELRRLYRAPDAKPDRGGAWAAGAVLVKAHLLPEDPRLVTRVDVRRRTPAGWSYEAWDPVTRARVKADVETCALCHGAAPKDETYTAF